jgi:AcrR family transcriptional regulator
MRARADAAAATGARILAAGRVRFIAQAYDEITLEVIAADAGVTVQTVLRRFGSKEGVARAIAEQEKPEVVSERDQAQAGDVAGAAANLVEHYEQVGAEVLQRLRQELRVPIFAEITASGRVYHAQWVERVFAPWLDSRSGADRKRLQAQLVAVCDIYTWYLLRRQSGLSRRATEQAIRELIEGALS